MTKEEKQIKKEKDHYENLFEENEIKDFYRTEEFYEEDCNHGN